MVVRVLIEVQLAGLSVNIALVLDWSLVVKVALFGRR